MDPERTSAFWQAVVQIIPVLALALVIEARFSAIIFVRPFSDARTPPSRRELVGAHYAMRVLATAMVLIELLGLLFIAIPRESSVPMTYIELALMLLAVTTIVFALVLVVLIPAAERTAPGGLASTSEEEPPVP